MTIGHMPGRKLELDVANFTAACARAVLLLALGRRPMKFKVDDDNEDRSS
jgi:hypothetical protein